MTTGMDPKQLIPMLNPKMSKQHRRSLLSPAQLQLARQFDNYTNLGTLSSVLGRPLRSTIKHVKQMAFLDVVHLYAPAADNAPPLQLTTDAWASILIAPIIAKESQPSQPSFRLPTSNPSMPRLQAWVSEANTPDDRQNISHRGEQLSTIEEIQTIHTLPVTPQTPAPSKPAANIHAPRATSPQEKEPELLTLTGDMEIGDENQGTELDLPLEDAVSEERRGFSVPHTPPKFASLRKINEMDWTSEHQTMSQNSPSQNSPLTPTPDKRPQLSPTEEELQLLLMDISKREQRKRPEKGLYHYSSRSQMDLPQPPQSTPTPSGAYQASRSGAHRPPTAAPPKTKK